MVHFGPFWPEEVHFGPFMSANRTLAIPEEDRRSFKGQTRLGATRPATLRGKWHSERVSERAFEKPSENLSKPLKTSETLPLRDPLRGRLPSQNLSGLFPLIVLPLNLSPRIGKIFVSASPRKWETDFLPLLVLTCQGRSTGKKQYW